MNDVEHCASFVAGEITEIKYVVRGYCDSLLPTISYKLQFSSEIEGVKFVIRSSLPHVIVGDEAFPLRTYLMRPYSRDEVYQNKEKDVFNYQFSCARNTL